MVASAFAGCWQCPSVSGCWLLDGYDTMGIGYMALWGFRAKSGTGVDGSGVNKKPL